MKKYKVLVEGELLGQFRKVDDIVDLTDAQAEHISEPHGHQVTLATKRDVTEAAEGAETVEPKGKAKD